MELSNLDEEDVEDLLLAQHAVVHWLVGAVAVEPGDKIYTFFVDELIHEPGLTDTQTDPFITTDVYLTGMSFLRANCFMSTDCSRERIRVVFIARNRSGSDT